MKTIRKFLKELWLFLLELFGKRRHKLKWNPLDDYQGEISYSLKRSKGDLMLEVRDSKDPDMLYWLEVLEEARGRFVLPVAYAVLPPDTKMNCFVSTQLGKEHPGSELLTFTTSSEPKALLS